MALRAENSLFGKFFAIVLNNVAILAMNHNYGSKFRAGLENLYYLFILDLH